MAVNVPNGGAWQQKVGNHCTEFRDALRKILDESAWMNANGGLTFLTAAQPNGLGLDPVDAQNIMDTIGAVNPNVAVVQQIQAWIDSTEFLWGGN